jgi:general secretion pathway protein D
VGRALRLAILVCAVLLLAFGNDRSDAKRLAREAAAAEKAGHLVEAYALYTQAARLDPSQTDYLMKAQSLRPYAQLAGEPKPVLPPDLAGGHITPSELAEARNPRPPVELQPKPGTQDFDLRGDSRTLFDRVAGAYGIMVVFESEYKPGPSLRFQMEGVGCRAALRALEAATDSFVVPAAGNLIFVANDTPDKRTRYENTMSVAIPIPDAVTPQELQELVAAVRGAMEIQRIVVDNEERIVLLRDRISKVRPAQALFSQLMRARTQLDIEVELLSTDKSTTLSWGFPLPNSFPLVDFGSISRLITQPNVPSGYSSFMTFGRGATLIGVGVTNSSLFAAATKALTATEYDAHVEASDGMPASVNIGQKFPIATTQYAGYTGSSSSSSQSLVGVPAPSVQFEDLGLNLKITPHVHGTDEISLDLEAQIELLGSASVDGIPELDNTRFQSTVRLREGQWAVITGMVTSSEAKTITGIAGVASIPILGPALSNNNTQRDRSEALIVIKPRLRSMPPSEAPTRSFWTGTESRPQTVL